MTATKAEKSKGVFHGKSFVVTGSEGFIGKRLNGRLLDLGAFTICVDIDNMTMSEGECEALVSSVDAVFHVGANSNTMEADTNLLFQQNFLATRMWAFACRQTATPLIFSSSAACYGEDGSSPSNPYGWSKYVSEELVLAMAGTSLRYFNVYGPGEGHKGNMASFAHQAFHLNKREGLVELFPGKPMRDFVHVDDVLGANLAAFENFELCKGRAFDVGTGLPTTFEQVLDYMGIPFGYQTPDSVPCGYQYFTKANETRSVPGWNPSIFPEKGFPSYKKWLSEL